MGLCLKHEPKRVKDKGGKNFHLQQWRKEAGGGITESALKALFVLSQGKFGALYKIIQKVILQANQATLTKSLRWVSDR